jgi:hypothetical protein
MIEVRPFEAAHLADFEPGATERAALGDTDLASAAAANRWAEHAASVIEDGCTLAIIAIAWRDAEAEISFLLSDAIRARPVMMTRAAMRVIAEMHGKGIERIYAEARPGSPQRFLVFLGFRVEGEKFVHV